MNKPVPPATIEKILDAARLSPTAKNVQPWRFVVITDKKVIQKISDLAPNGKFVIEAPVCVAVFCQDTKYYLEDGCAATTNILNAAAELEIGSCWIAGDKKPYCPDVAKLVNAPSGYNLVSLIALGYSQEAPQPQDKKELSSLIRWEKF